MARKSEEISHEIKKLIIDLNPPPSESTIWSIWKTIISTGDEIWETPKNDGQRTDFCGLLEKTVN